MKSKNMIFFKQNKYKNCSCFVDGIRFDSRREAAYYGQLKLEKRGGLIFDFEHQVTFDLYGTEIDCEPEMARQKRICQHRVDFVVTLPNGDKEVREVKGFATPEWNLKRKLFEANYPDIAYRVVK